MVTLPPIKTINQNVTLQTYTQARAYTPSELANIQKGLTQTMPTLIKSNGTPLWKLLADPRKYAALWSGLTGATAAVWGDIATHIIGATDTWFHPISLMAGLGGGALGAGYGFIKQAQANENILDFTRLSQVENPSIRVFKADLSNLLTTTAQRPIMRETLQNVSRLF